MNRSMRQGVTLIELLVVLAILGVVVVVSVFSAKVRLPEERSTGWRIAAARARQQAIGMGKPVRDTFSDSAGLRFLLALPDGQVIGDSVLPLERLSGRPRAHE